jgi:hypothetical protein
VGQRERTELLLLLGLWTNRLLKTLRLPDVTCDRNLNRGTLLRMAFWEGVTVTLTVEVVVPVVDQVVCERQ